MKELRICELRADIPAGNESLILEGMPIVYDQPTTINDPAGKYIEIIRSGALDGADLSDARLFRITSYNVCYTKLLRCRVCNKLHCLGRSR